jgi:PLD-like domain
MIAVAYFSPDKSTIGLLRSIPKLQIVLSDEFPFLSPSAIDELKGTADIRYVPTAIEQGKLHSKIYFGKLDNGDKYLFIGSANLTHNGFFANSESGILVESSDKNSEDYFKQFTRYFNELVSKSERLDPEFLRSRSNIRRPDPPEYPSGYCVLKTTDGSTHEDFWDQFLDESVIAIGWDALQSNPITDKREIVFNELQEEYGRKKAEKVYSKINTFVNLTLNDYVIIAQGYPPNSSSDVYLYGIARVLDHVPYKDSRSNWWKLKHKAEIQRIELSFPKKLFIETLNRHSLREAIHSINRNEFCRFVNRLGTEHDIHLKV